MNQPEPIIRSLLDLDFYKLTMAQVAWKYFRDVPVKYSFRNRTKSVALADFVREEDLRRELEHIRGLKFAEEEITFLRESQFIPKGMFSEKFLEFLSRLQLCDFQLTSEGGNYRIEASGKWPEAIFWETLILSAVNELYYRALLEKEGKTFKQAQPEGQRRLRSKIQIMMLKPGIKFTDFGTRRRFSRDWQEEVVKTCKEQLPNQFLGTSNILLTKKFGLRPIGTFAHEMYMIFSGIYHENDEAIRASHNQVLQTWGGEYGEPLSIALTDTYGTDFFFRDFQNYQARAWKGLRQDSGDPFEFGEKAIAFYEKLGINPENKLIVFSDGLDMDMIIRLYNQFQGRIQIAFGWGTNLTNDLGFKALSLVVKASEANGHGTVKLSDNLAKAMGSPEDIERFKKIFGHTIDTNEECKY